MVPTLHNLLCKVGLTVADFVPFHPMPLGGFLGKLEKFEEHLADVADNALSKVEQTVHADLDGDGLVGENRVKWSNAELSAKSDAELDDLFDAIHYDEACAHMGTGDIILLHGTEMFSMTIKAATRSWYPLAP